jgi:hypothetical protein
MSEIKSYRDLLIWQKGITFVNRVYQETTRFPDSERYGLGTGQPDAPGGGVHSIQYC